MTVVVVVGICVRVSLTIESDSYGGGNDGVTKRFSG